MSLTAFQSLYMALAVDITDGRGLSNEVHREFTVEKEQGNAVLAFLITVNYC